MANVTIYEGLGANNHLACPSCAEERDLGEPIDRADDPCDFCGARPFPQLDEMVSGLRNGSGPLTRLTTWQLQQIVSAFAPYGREARELFFDKLRETADRQHPTRY